MNVFDPDSWRNSLRSHLIAEEAARAREDFLPNAVGRAAESGLQTCLYGWFAGMRCEVAPLLEKYRGWFEDSIARDEQSGDPPSRFAAQRLEGLAIATWMLEGVSDPHLYARSLRFQEQTVAAEAAAKKIPLDVAWAPHAGRYLRTWILAGDPAHGALTVPAQMPETGADARDEEAAAALALCRADWGHAPPDKAALAAGEALLRSHLADDWLDGGLALTAALWLKTLYFVSGQTPGPEQTLMRAYDLMPDVRRP
jgi:hypothetical protein